MAVGLRWCVFCLNLSYDSKMGLMLLNKCHLTFGGHLVRKNLNSVLPVFNTLQGWSLKRYRSSCFNSEMHGQDKTWARTWILYHTDLPERENELWNFYLLHWESLQGCWSWRVSKWGCFTPKLWCFPKAQTPPWRLEAHPWRRWRNSICKPTL